MDDKLTDEKINLFKQKLDDRSIQGYKNWLVIYAGYNTPKEKIRFKNPNWIFWDINKDERYSIKGSFNQDNLIKLHTILGNTFDYICFDDDINEYYPYNKEKLIYRLLKMLKPNGILVIQNVFNFDDINNDGYAQQAFLSKKSRSTPYGTGYGGSTLLNDIINILRHIKEQNINSVIISKYENIQIVNDIFNNNDEFANNFNRCDKILRLYIMGNVDLNSKICIQFIKTYKDLYKIYESNKEKLYEEYYKLLEEIVSLWKPPDYAIDATNYNQNYLFFIKKLDYPSNLYS